MQERTAELRESEARYRSLTELASDWYWEQDENGNFTKVSGPVLEMLGIRVDALGGEAAAMRRRRAGTRRSGRRCRRRIAARQPFLDFVFSRVNADGSQQKFQVSGEPMFNQSCRFIGYRGIGVELTARNSTQSRRSSMPSPHSPNQNHLLAALPTAEFERLAAHLELVPMPLGEILYEPGGQLQHAYFPTTAIVSLHYVTESGASAEIAGVGNEGVVGISLFMGGDTTPSSAVVQTAGHAYRLARRLLKQEFDRGRPDAAPAAALHPGADHADDADRGLQPAPFGGAAAVPLAVADARPSALAASWS